MKTRGRGFNKEEFYSFCSRHREHNEDCDLCQKGIWVNVFQCKLGTLIYWISPTLWRWLW